jgi:HKD family nuclease
MRRNVLNWLSQQFTDATHAVMLTHNIDFLFVQGVLVPRLRWAGNPRLTIFADANCAVSTYRDQRAVLDGLGVRYRVVPVDLGPMRRFHPKVLLLSNHQRAVCAVGSGNLTHGGMSANHEVWTFGASDGEGASLLASLRDYIRMLVELLGLAEPVRNDMDAIFDEEQTWVADLPLASRLLMSPSDRPILDQIADFVTGEVKSISVLAPYFDPDGAALAELRRRFGVPVTVWLQPGREGLSSVAAAALPEGITLKTIDCLEERRPSFIHAKLLAFHRANDIVLAIGSANCSRAGLLSNRDWGNAELMVVDSVVPEVFRELFADLVQSDTPPKLPEQPLSDEPELEVPRLRILAARLEGNRLDVAFKSAEPLSRLAVEAEEAVWPASHVDCANGLVAFPMSNRPSSITLTGTTAAGEQLRSPEAWVDDEASLAAPASLRRMIRQLQEADPVGGELAGEFRAVLDQFRDYLRDPDASRRRMRRSGEAREALTPYDPTAVFSDEFGKAVGATPRQTDFSHNRKSVLAIVEALFAISSAVGGAPPDPDGSGEDPDSAAEEEKLISRPIRPPEARVTEQLRRALKNVEAALLESNFITARRPGLLGADTALAAILLVKGLADGYLDVEQYRETTRRLWGELFFGSEGDGTGSIGRRLQQLGACPDRYRDQ